MCGSLFKLDAQPQDSSARGIYHDVYLVSVSTQYLGETQDEGITVIDGIEVFVVGRLRQQDRVRVRQAFRKVCVGRCILSSAKTVGPGGQSANLSRPG